MRTLSARAMQALTSSETGEILLTVLRLRADGIDPVNIVNNIDPVTSRGITYEPYPFDFALFSDDGKTLPQAKLIISNVDLRLVEGVRSAMGPIQLDIDQVLASQPDIVEIASPGLILRNVTYDAQQISGTLMPDDVLNGQLPGDSYNPEEFRALF